MDIRPFFISDAQATELMQPGDRSFDDPALRAQARTVRQSPPCQSAVDAPLGQCLPVRLRIIRTIAQHSLRTVARGTAFAANRRNCIDQRQQLRHIVRIGTGDDRRQRHAVGVGDQVMLGAGLAAIRRIRSSFFPPRTARTDEESTTARDRSSCSRRRSSDSTVAWSCSQTPARCQSRKRRQHVIPQQPSSAGSISQGMPLLSTNRIPVSATRSSTGLRPGCLNRRGGRGGNNGAISVHRSSSSRGLAISISRKGKRVGQAIMVY